jgi:hypothetical protein
MIGSFFSGFWLLQTLNLFFSTATRLQPKNHRLPHALYLICWKVAVTQERCTMLSKGCPWAVDKAVGRYHRSCINNPNADRTRDRPISTLGEHAVKVNCEACEQRLRVLSKPLFLSSWPLWRWLCQFCGKKSTKAFPAICMHLHCTRWCFSKCHPLHQVMLFKMAAIWNWMHLY